MIKGQKPIVLLPYDFTEVSKYAVKHAVAVAKLFGYSITLLNILDNNTKLYMKMSNMKNDDLIFKLKEMCDFIKQVNNVNVDYFYQKGSIKSICKIAKKLNVSFMVLGIDEPRGNTTAIMKVVSNSTVPVFVIQQKSDITEYKHLLFPLDDSPGSRQKAGWAAKIAKTSGAHISILSVNDPNRDKRIKQQVIAAQVEEYFIKYGLKCTTDIAKGKPKDFALDSLEFGKEKKCDVYIIMHRPKKLFSTVDPIDKQFIFNDTKTPVLCVNLRDIGVMGGFN
jgi:nucleotide-binding universal stress UspA family protein